MPSQTTPSETILAPAERSSHRIASILMLALAALWCIYWFIHARRYWEDDAYIHLEFARSVFNGLGFSFNGHVVAGDTAPLWVWMLAAMHAVIPNWLMAGKMLSVVGAGFGLTGAYLFARKLAVGVLPPSVAGIFPAAMVLLIVANPYTCYWIFSGMEPITAAGVAFFAVLAATHRRPSTGLFLTGCLFAGIAPLLRPEMIFFTALLAFALLGQWSRLGSKAVAFVAGLLLICGPVALWSLYSLHAFGHLLPNTNAAKRAAPTDSVLHRLVSIYSAGLPLIVCGLLAGVVYLVLRPSSVRRSIQGAIGSAFARSTNPQQDAAGFPLAGWIFILWPLIASIFYVADHTYVQTRYILVTAPGLMIVIMALFLRDSLRTGRVVYAAALLAALTVSIVTVRPFLRNKGLMCVATDGFANFMRNQIPPNDPVAAYSIGQVAFVSEHPIIDTGGITRPGVIPYLNSAPDRLRWAESEGARYIIDDHQPEPGATNVYTGQLPFIGWTFHTSRYATFSTAEIWKLPPSAERALPPLTSASAKP